MQIRTIRVFLPFFMLFFLLFPCLGVRAEEMDKIPDQITVVYTSPAHEPLALDYSLINSIENVSDTVDVFHLNSSDDAEFLLEDIRNQEGVLAADYESEAKITSTPNDAYYASSQNYLKKIGYENIRIGEHTAKVAVLDTGVDPGQEDLRGRVEQTGYNYVLNTAKTSDMNGHGTAVSGVIAAQTNNRTGIAGAAGKADVKIVPYAVLDSEGKGALSSVAAAMQAILSRPDIKVVNLSIALDSTSSVMESLCAQASSAGKILVSSTGNTGISTVAYPARYDTVIAVGACNDRERRCDVSDWGSGASSYGTGIDLLAPGNNIIAPSIRGGQKYKAYNGTSFAAPIVSAACALAATHDPNIDFATVKERLHSSCKDVYSRGWDMYSGYGIIKYDAFVNSFYHTTVQIPNNTLQTDGTGSIALNNTSVSMMPGSSTTLTAKTTNNIPVLWTSSNSTVATVSDGKVDAVAPGTATITATLRGSNIYTTCEVKVLEYLGYEAHVSNIGWMAQVSDGEIAGTTGRNLALEGLIFKPKSTSLGINARAHVENIGWQDTKTSGNLVGTTGQNLQMEALELTLTGPQAESYDILYRGHVENYGWTAWASNGTPVGTQGQNLQLEAIQVKILPKGSTLTTLGSNVNWSFME